MFFSELRTVCDSAIAAWQTANSRISDSAVFREVEMSGVRFGLSVFRRSASGKLESSLGISKGVELQASGFGQVGEMDSGVSDQYCGGKNRGRDGNLGKPGETTFWRGLFQCFWWMILHVYTHIRQAGRCLVRSARSQKLPKPASSTKVGTRPAVAAYQTWDLGAYVYILCQRLRFMASCASMMLQRVKMVFMMSAPVNKYIIPMLELDIRADRRWLGNIRVLYQIYICAMRRHQRELRSLGYIPSVVDILRYVGTYVPGVNSGLAGKIQQASESFNIRDPRCGTSVNIYA